MNSRPAHWPADFAAFRNVRNRVFDNLAADAVLVAVERQTDPRLSRGGDVDADAAEDGTSTEPARRAGARGEDGWD